MFTVKSTMSEIRQRFNPDFVFANADSATGGAGLGVQQRCISGNWASTVSPWEKRRITSPIYDRSSIRRQAGFCGRPISRRRSRPRLESISERRQKNRRDRAFSGSRALRGSTRQPISCRRQLSRFLHRTRPASSSTFHAATTQKSSRLPRHATAKCLPSSEQGARFSPRMRGFCRKDSRHYRSGADWQYIICRRLSPEAKVKSSSPVCRSGAGTPRRSRKHRACACSSMTMDLRSRSNRSA